MTLHSWDLVQSCHLHPRPFRSEAPHFDDGDANAASADGPELATRDPPPHGVRRDIQVCGDLLDPPMIFHCSPSFTESVAVGTRDNQEF